MTSLLCVRGARTVSTNSRERCVCSPNNLCCFSWTGCIDLLIHGFTCLSLALCVCTSISCHSQALWFPLLEAMMSPQKLLKGADAKHTSDGETQTHKWSSTSVTPRPQRIFKYLLLYFWNDDKDALLKKKIETIVVYRLNKIYAAGLQVESDILRLQFPST